MHAPPGHKCMETKLGKNYAIIVGCLLAGFVLRHINPFRVIYRRIKFQTIQFSISIVIVYKQLNIKTVLFQTIQFSISTQLSYI